SRHLTHMKTGMMQYLPETGYWISGLGPARKLSVQSSGFWADGIIPFAVEFVAHDVHGSEFVVGYSDAGRVGHGIELATDLETGSGGGCGDQLHDHLMA